VLIVLTLFKQDLWGKYQPKLHILGDKGLEHMIPKDLSLNGSISGSFNIHPNGDDGKIVTLVTIGTLHFCRFNVSFFCNL
jgi:hypothetical protein